MPARVSLALLAMLGMINTVMVRVNLSVAIVAMVRRNLTSVTQVQAHCVATTTHQGLEDGGYVDPSNYGKDSSPPYSLLMLVVSRLAVVS